MGDVTTKGSWVYTSIRCPSRQQTIKGQYALCVWGAGTKVLRGKAGDKKM